ncbi:MAG: hypothetical protein ACQKBY_06025 [Verrucomicrobiales bacterium]
MPDVVIESLLRITHDPAGTPTVLLDFGEDITSLPELDGEQMVEVGSFVRSAAASTFARGNEQHTFTIAGAREALSVRGAHDRLFAGALAVPRGTADVLFEVQDGGAWRLEDATVRAWPARVDEHFCDRQIEIIGGALVEVTPPPADSYTAPTGTSPHTYELPGEKEGTGGGEGGSPPSGALYVKYVAQTLDETQQTQARENIGAASAAGLSALQRDVDDLDSAAVKTTGSQTIAGAKTFASPVTVGAATADGHATSRAVSLALAGLPRAVNNFAVDYPAGGGSLTTTHEYYPVDLNFPTASDARGYYILEVVTGDPSAFYYRFFIKLRRSGVSSDFSSGQFSQTTLDAVNNASHFGPAVLSLPSAGPLKIAIENKISGSASWPFNIKFTPIL